MLEKNFWSIVKKNLPPKCLATRIENRNGGGVPDVHLVWDGLCFWTELKVTKGYKVNLSPEQIAWNTAYSHYGGINFILVKAPRDGNLFLFSGRDSGLVSRIGTRAPCLYKGNSYNELWGKVRESGFGILNSGRVGTGVFSDPGGTSIED